MTKPWRGQPTPDEFWTYTTKTDAGCWLWKGTVIQRPNGAPGYGYCWWKGRRDMAHRVAFELSTGTPAPTRESGRVVMHRCDVPTCVNPAHLRLGTVHDNSIDMSNKGRGSEGGVRRLDAVTVRRIRELVAMGFRQDALAKLVKVSNASISAIVARRTWQHVE